MNVATQRQKAEREVRYADTRERIDQHEQGWTPTTFKLPENVEQFRFKKPGTYTVDIIPYVVQKTREKIGGNPFVSKQGVLYWERTFFDHQDVGMDKQRQCCLRKNWSEPCPICDHLAELSQDPKLSDEIKKALREKERQLFYFKVHEELDKGIQVHECSHYMGFGELLENKLGAARKKKDNHPYLNFFYLGEEGKSLEITTEEKTFSNKGRSGKYNATVNIEFVEREDPDEINMDLVENLTPLDDLLVRKTYKKLKSIFLQTPAKAEPEDNGKSKGKTKPPKDEDEDEEGTDDVEDEEKDDDAEHADEDEEGHESGSEDSDEEAEEDGEKEESEEEENDELEEESEEEAEEEEPEPPKKPAKRGVKPSAKSEDNGETKTPQFTKGMKVKHPKWGICTVMHSSQDGKTVRLEDKDGDLKLAVPVHMVQKIGKK